MVESKQGGSRKKEIFFISIGTYSSQSASPEGAVLLSTFHNKDDLICRICCEKMASLGFYSRHLTDDDIRQIGASTRSLICGGQRVHLAEE
jgi:hypothetical protein